MVSQFPTRVRVRRSLLLPISKKKFEFNFIATIISFYVANLVIVIDAMFANSPYIRCAWTCRVFRMYFLLVFFTQPILPMVFHFASKESTHFTSWKLEVIDINSNWRLLLGNKNWIYNVAFKLLLIFLSLIGILIRMVLDFR